MRDQIDNGEKRSLQWIADETGAAMAEYGLLAVLIGAFMVVAVAFFGDSVLGVFEAILDALPF